MGHDQALPSIGWTGPAYTSTARAANYYSQHLATCDWSAGSLSLDIARHPGAGPEGAGLKVSPSAIRYRGEVLARVAELAAGGYPGVEFS